MNNSIGFEDDRLYKIVSVADNTNFKGGEIDGTKLICAPEDNEKKELQRFHANAQDAGDFRLSSKFQTTSDFVQVWDYLPHRSLLIQKKQSAAEISTQIWRAHTVPGLNCIFLMISVSDPNKCLKNMNSDVTGTGQQIKVVDKSNALMIGDSYTYWRLEAEPLV